MPCATYQRYSDQDQKQTSINDQLRNCQHLARQHGLFLDARLQFKDEAVSGRASGLSKRKGYQRLLDAFDCGEFETLIVDEVSRLTRDIHEGARIMRLIEDRGLRIITGDGIDTARENWKSMWLLKLMSADMEVTHLGQRTRRGMVGALERGFQVAPAPYGYRRVRAICPISRREVTRWEIDDECADLVRLIFELKFRGHSLVKIAGVLNERSIAIPSPSRSRVSAHWRGATIHRLLSNTIYRGVFTFNNSTTHKAQARKRRRNVEPLEFARPELRIVSDEVWFACNASTDSKGGKVRAPRGGGRHLLAGLMRCGDCNALMSVSGGPKSFGMYCPQCESGHRAHARESWLGYTSHTTGVNALRAGIAQLFTQEVHAEFKLRLRERFESGPRQEIEAVKQRVSDLTVRLERTKEIMKMPSIDPELFKDDLLRDSDALKTLKRQLEVLQAQAKTLTPAVLKAQLDVNLEDAFDAMLDGAVEVYAAKATLRRMLKRFVFTGRNGGKSIFLIEFLPGMAVAEASGTCAVDMTVTAFEVSVTVSKARPTRWTTVVRRLSAQELLLAEPVAEPLAEPVPDPVT